MNKAVAKSIRIRHLEHSRENREREGNARTAAFKLSNAAFNAVDQQIRTVDALPVAILENRQVTPYSAEEITRKPQRPARSSTHCVC